MFVLLCNVERHAYEFLVWLAVNLNQCLLFFLLWEYYLVFGVVSFKEKLCFEGYLFVLRLSVNYF